MKTYNIKVGIVGDEIPIAITKNIGHGTDSKAIIIGEELKLMVE